MFVLMSDMVKRVGSSRTWLASVNQVYINSGYKSKTRISVRSCCALFTDPRIGLSCLENELIPTYVKALSRNKDIVLTGDANCDLLLKTTRGDALRSFCASVNVHKLIDRPSRVTMTSRSLLDIVMLSKKDIVKTSGVLDLTIGDHNLVYVFLNMKVPKPPPIYFTTRSFKNYTADQFSSDIANTMRNCEINGLSG